MGLGVKSLNVAVLDTTRRRVRSFDRALLQDGIYDLYDWHGRALWAGGRWYVFSLLPGAIKTRAVLESPPLSVMGAEPPENPSLFSSKPPPSWKAGQNVLVHKRV